VREGEKKVILIDERGGEVVGSVRSKEE